MSRYKLLSATCVLEGTVLAIALFLAKFFDVKLLFQTENLLYDFLIGVFGAWIPLSLFIFLLSKRVETIPFIGSLRKLVITDIKPIFDKANLFDLYLISLFAGFAEELLFRGVLQVTFGIAPASIIFGLLHFITPAYGIFVTIMGFYIGILFHLHQSILTPVLLHFFYDFGALVYLRYFVKT